MNRISKGFTGYFTRDGQHGRILDVFNGGLFALFQSDSGARFTILEDEFERDIPETAPNSHPEERAGHEEGLRAMREAQAERFAQVSRTVAAEDRARKQPLAARVIALVMSAVKGR